VPSVRVGVSSVQNPKLAAHLTSLGDSNDELEVVRRQFVFWFTRVPALGRGFDPTLGAD
jgi:hypothetical protein